MIATIHVFSMLNIFSMKCCTSAKNQRQHTDKLDPLFHFYLVNRSGVNGADCEGGMFTALRIESGLFYRSNVV